MNPRNILFISASILLIFLIPCAWVITTEVGSLLHAWSLVPGTVTAQLSRVVDGDPNGTLPEDKLPLRAVLLTRVDATGQAVRVDLNKQVLSIKRDVNGQITSLRADIMPRVDNVVGLGNNAVGMVKGAVDKVDERIASIQADAKPVLVNTAALIKDTQDSLDDVYWDGKALLESATVTSRQIASTMEEVRRTTPQFLATFQETNKQFSGIATDVHTLTSKFVAPTSTKQKIWEGFKSMALISARFL